MNQSQRMIESLGEAGKKVDPSAVGKKVKITAVAFPNNPNHAKFVGKIGVIKKVNKSQNEYDIVFDDGSKRSSNPENVEFV